MDRRTVQIALVAGLGILAIGLAAATLTSSVSPEHGVGGGSPGSGDGDADGIGGSPPVADDRPVDFVDVPFASELLLFLVVLAAIVLVGYAVLHWREAVALILGLAVVTGIVLLLVDHLSQRSTSEESMTGGLLPGEGGGTGGMGGGGSPSVALLVALVLGLGVLVAAALAVSSSNRSTSTTSDELVDPSETTRIGRAAGRAADRIEAGNDVDNDVYRAWEEMTELLDVSDPETTTPGEFSSVAIETGMDPEHVGELTRLFEDVRYGGYTPTDERERRAIRVFRQIERTHAPERP